MHGFEDGANVEDNDDDIFEINEEQAQIKKIAKKEKLTLECMSRRLEEAIKDPTKAYHHIHILTLTTEALC